jgi:hypothetical protein
MSSPFTRRRFMTGTLQAGALAGLADLGFLKGLPSLSAAAGPVVPKVVPVSSDLEPLVRLIEDTPRKALLEKVADQIREGTGYQQLLGAVFLAGVRGIQPRPVGFKFHAVLVINSAHLASQAAADKDRWLPLFWALDYFKDSQAQNKARNDWMMAPVVEAELPPPTQAKKRFVEAMDDWDVEGADAAVAALARSAGAGEVIELFWRYGARDFRDIGHKAIYVANGWRTLQTIGWRHAEPFLRSLAYALLEHEGGNPAKRDDHRDRPGRDNLKRAAELAKLPRGGKRSPAAGADLLATLREASAADAAAKVAALLTSGVHPASVWDGLFLAAGELLARQPGIVGLHCVTSVNALHFGYQTSADETTRRFLMLQTASFLALFRLEMKGRGKLSDLRLDKLERIEGKGDAGETIGEIFADVTKDPTRAARKTLDLMTREPARIRPMMAAARRLVFAKGTNAHDYKFSSAALEDYFHVSPAWRGHYAAAAMFDLKGSGDADNPLVKRTRAALGRA